MNADEQVVQRALRTRSRATSVRVALLLVGIGLLGSVWFLARPPAPNGWNRTSAQVVNVVEEDRSLLCRAVGACRDQLLVSLAVRGHGERPEANVAVGYLGKRPERLWVRFDPADPTRAVAQTWQSWGIIAGLVGAVLVLVAVEELWRHPRVVRHTRAALRDGPEASTTARHRLQVKRRVWGRHPGMVVRVRHWLHLRPDTPASAWVPVDTWPLGDEPVRLKTLGSTSPGGWPVLLTDSGDVVFAIGTVRAERPPWLRPSATQHVESGGW